MWQITPWDVIHLRQGTGDRLTALADDLIRAECLCAAMPLSAVHSNLRTNLGDKGVDTRVADASADEPTGWLRQYTIWQYKAMAYADLGPRARQDEIGKEYAAQCIREGYAYRFVVADELPAATKQQWEQDFGEWAGAINPEAFKPMVLGAGDLAAWANRYPALVAKHFAHRIAPNAMYLGSWGPSITSLTPDYVPVPNWADTEEAVRRHCDFQHSPADAVFVVQGEAGVGKTRLIYESVSRIPEGALVVYTLDPGAAIELAYRLANDPTLRAIVVADECDVDSRYQLKTIVQGHRSRVRVIAIDNSGVRTPLSAAPEYWLQTVPENVVEAVLGRNFPAVPQDRRRAYASLAGGFITLAADLCLNDAEIVNLGGVESLPAGIYDYYRRRLSETDRLALETLSLVRAVGYTEDRAAELDALCAITGQNAQAVRERLLHLHDVPGFVGRGGRLLYVTPEVIAHVAFGNAWSRWASHDPAAFLERIPVVLLDAFLERVRTTAGKEVRDVVADFFRAWCATLTPTSLNNSDDVERLATLTEANPVQLLPVIRSLVDDANRDQLLGTAADDRRGWDPRRKLVWLCEHLARLPESFYDAEAILLRLALHETEPNVANNATGVWTHLYKIVFSGTPIPFLDRLSLLRQRLRSADSGTVGLALGALEAALDPRAFDVVPPPVIAGRIPPPQWQPGSHNEALECVRAAFAELGTVITSGSEQGDQAVKIAIDRLFTLVADGLLDDCRRILRPDRMSAERLAELLNTIEQILARDRQLAPSDALRGNVAGELRNWIAHLRPEGLHERLVTAVAVDPWRKQRDETSTDWTAELAALAAKLLDNPALAVQELPWLLSRAARASTYFGERVGRLDESGILLGKIVEAVDGAEDSGFIRGYLDGLFTHGTARFGGSVNEWLDSIEETHPQVVYEISVTSPDAVNGFERVLRLVGHGQLAGAYLRIFGRRIGQRAPTELELARMLSVLVQRADAGDKHSVEAALDVVGGWIHRNPGDLRNVGRDTLSLFWKVAELGGKNPGHEAYEWLNLMLLMVPEDPARAAELAADALVGDRISHRDETDQILQKVAQCFPEAVMRAIGRVALDRETGWRLTIGKHRVFSALPDDVLLNWIDQNGVEAARIVARHLPTPFLQDGIPVVPARTARVLEKYGEDKYVFGEFSAGVHDFQSYNGNIAGLYEQEAALATNFLKSPISAIRRWAEAERELALSQAENWRRREGEEGSRHTHA